jgi:putative variant cofactor biosynthesis B12-binding/radical SAM domain protein 1
MRVLMVQTPSVEGVSSERVYPLGLVLLAGRIRGAGHDVEIIDMNLRADPYGALKERLLDSRPHVVCLSLRNIDPLGNKHTSLVPPFVAAARLICAVSPETTVLAGGTGFSLFPERLMREVPKIRYGLVGEAEESLPRLLSSLDNPPRLKGLCHRKGGRIRMTPPARDFDMSAYVPPERGLLDPSAYLDINTYVPAIGIETKRGCPFGCSYCVYPMLQGKRLRLRPPKAVVDEMESLRHEYGVERFHFTDPVLNAPRGHLERICEELLRRKLNVRWDGFMRENLLNEKNVALFEKAGCECFSFSPDGLCTQSLRVLGKGMDESHILGAARLVSKTDVTCVYHFMVNVPGENEETCKAAFTLLGRLYELHSRKRNLGTIVLNNLRILPGTAIEDRARAEGVIGPDTDLLYPTYYNPPPFDALRYRLETLHFCKNVFSWQGIR